MEIFIRKWSKVSGVRFDPLYYREISLGIQTCPLKQIVVIKSGKRIPKGKTYSTSVTPYKYLRVDDLNSDTLEVDIDSLKSIDEEIFTFLKRYEIHNGDIALSIAGTIGKIFLFENLTDNKVILTENCVKLQVQKNILPKFLSIVLKTTFLQNQMKREYIQTTIPKLAIERVKGLKIPKIPPIPTQEKIIAIMDNAYRQKEAKEQKAKEILDSIDSYLMQELGINLPNNNCNSLEQRIFTQKISHLSGTRFDPNYHQKYYQDLEQALTQSIYPLVNLSQIITSFKKGIEVGSEAYSQTKEIPFIRVSDIDNEGISYDKVEKFITTSLYENLKSFQPQQNELLYSKDGTIGFCLKADTSRDYIISGGILRLEFKKEVNIDFVQNILASHLLNILANRKAIGAVIKHLGVNEFLNLKIPLPPLAMQEKLVHSIQERKEKATLLKNQAKEILGAAKINVENMILATSAGGGG